MTIRPDINMPERAPELRGHHPLVADFNDGYNAALDEVARLNPADPEMHYMDCGVAGGFPHPASACQSECGCDKEGPTNPDTPRPNGGMPIPTEADWRQRVRTLSAEVARLTAERDAWKATAGAWLAEHQPDAPPIPCVEVDATDGRRTWRAMGEDVQTLGDGWEIRMHHPATRYWRAVETVDVSSVYAIRRTAPAEPTTERVPWWEAVGRTNERGKIIAVRCNAAGVWIEGETGWMQESVDPDGTVEVLVEDDT